MFSIQALTFLTIIISSNAHSSFPMGGQMVEISRTELVRKDSSQNRVGYQASGGETFCSTGKICGSNDVFTNCCPHLDGVCCGNSLCCQRGESCCAGKCCPVENAICCHTYCCAWGTRCSGQNNGRCIPFGNNGMNTRTSNTGCISSLTLAYLLGLHRLYLIIAT